MPGKGCRGGLCGACFVFPEVHAFDEAVLDGVDVPDFTVRKNIAGETFHELVNLDGGLPVFAVDHFEGFHVRIKLLPLTCPVGANLLFPNDTATLGCLGPANVSQS